MVRWTRLNSLQWIQDFASMMKMMMKMTMTAHYSVGVPIWTSHDCRNHRNSAPIRKFIKLYKINALFCGLFNNVIINTGTTLS